MTRRIRTLIVDDMALARNRLRRHLTEDPEIEIAGEAAGGRAAIEAIRSLKPELVFLDVQMPEIGGFEVLAALGGEMPAIVFVTAFDQYAVKAFEVHAVDYLLKPFDDERLKKAVGRAKREIRRGEPLQGAERLRRLLEDVGEAAKHPSRLAIRSQGRTVFLPVDEIDYIEAAGNYLRIQAGAESHMIRERISAMEERLDPTAFARIHRSTIVNLARVKEMQPLVNGDQMVILRTGKRLTMSRTYREAVMGRMSRSS
jgi:two-component system LytT family response regulator